MCDFETVTTFVETISADVNYATLHGALADITDRLGFDHFALTQHIDYSRAGRSTAVRLHNYPAGWQEWFDARGLGETDPVHRASHRTAVGFAWSDLDRLIRLSVADRDVLVQARRRGIGDGFTVPAHVPGESRGSCSFANRTGRPVRPESYPLAQLAGAYAFEAARRLHKRPSPQPWPSLTRRQRECIVWMARGKSDWEISRILGISHETVIRHIKQARERYGVDKRASLAIRALFDEQISFAELLS